MHRALCRAIRGTCRKWRENEVPVVAGEEVRKNQDKKEKFVPPGHTFNEALGWGGLLFLSFDFLHRRKTCFKSIGHPEQPDVSTTTTELPTTCSLKKCPFVLVNVLTQAVNQPVFYSSAKFINSSKVDTTPRHNHTTKSTVLKRSSIDTSPFLPETFLTFSDSGTEIDEDESGIFFEDNPDSLSLPINKCTESSKPSDAELASAAERVSGDILGVYGAFRFLIGKRFESPSSSPSSSLTMTTAHDAPLSAVELMEKGAEMGSSRALYNIGVAYDRLGNEDLAKEYYRRAATNGHILAAYNLAVYYLREMVQFDEGISLMRYAEQNGVPEARDFFKDMKSK